MGPQKLSKGLLTGHTPFLSVTHLCQCTLHKLNKTKSAHFRRALSLQQAESYISQAISVENSFNGCANVDNICTNDQPT